MPNTLGLDDDLDSVDAVIGLEKSFALQISDDEALSCNTVGDIYDLLQSRFSWRLAEPGSCMTSMAFYRLRRSLRSMRPGVEFRPDTPLAPLAGSNARTFLDQLQSGSALQLPPPKRRWLSGVGGLVILSSVLSVMIAAATKGSPLWDLAATVLFGLGAAAIKLDPGALSRDCATLGGLAAKVSALNYGALARSGGAVRAKDLWDAMTEVLSGVGGLPKADIRRDTLICHFESPSGRWR